MRSAAEKLQVDQRVLQSALLVLQQEAHDEQLAALARVDRREQEHLVQESVEVPARLCNRRTMR